MRKTQKARDGVPMFGVITMTLRDAATGAVKSRRTIRNKITFLAADVLVELLAQRANAAGIERAVFDRGGDQYHGSVQALADGAREGGLAV